MNPTTDAQNDDLKTAVRDLVQCVLKILVPAFKRAFYALLRLLRPKRPGPNFPSVPPARPRVRWWMRLFHAPPAFGRKLIGFGLAAFLAGFLLGTVPTGAQPTAPMPPGAIATAQPWIYQYGVTMNATSPIGGANVFTMNGTWAGSNAPVTLSTSGTFSGNPTFTGNPVFSGTPTFNSPVNFGSNLTNYLVATGTGSGAPSLSAAGSGANVDLALDAKGSAIIHLGNPTQTWFEVTGPATSTANFVECTAELTTVAPGCFATGSDTNVTLTLYATQAAQVLLGTCTAANCATSTTWAAVQGDTNGVNYLILTGKAAGSYPVLQATGSDSAVGMNLTTKGAGTVQINAKPIAQQFEDGNISSVPNGGNASATFTTAFPAAPICTATSTTTTASGPLSVTSTSTAITIYNNGGSSVGANWMCAYP